MSKLARLAAFSVALGLLISSASEEVLAQKKKKDAAPADVGNPAEPADYKNLGKEITGTVTSVGNGGLIISFRVDTQYYEPNPNYKGPQAGKNGNNNPQNQAQNDMMRRYQDLMRQQQLAMQAKTPQQRQQAMQRIQQDMVRLQADMQKIGMYASGVKGAANPNNQPFRVATKSKDFELEIQDKVVVRKMYLPLEYDDLGNIKTYSDKEKAELRGDDKSKPGYKSKIDEVYPGVEARLVLSPAKPAKKDKDAEKKPDEDGPGTNIARPTVNMIILTKDAPTPGMTGAEAKKEKKKAK